MKQSLQIQKILQKVEGQKKNESSGVPASRKFQQQQIWLQPNYTRCINITWCPLSFDSCTLCNSHIYIGSSAKSDVIRHAKTQNHLKLVSFQNQSKPISSFLQVQTVMIRSLKLRHCFLTLLQNITFRLQFLIISQNFARKSPG